jgi:hypothetical protein
MEQTLDMKKIEQKSYRFIEQDGLTEIMMGVLLVGIGITYGSKVNGILVIAAIFVLAPLLRVLRNRYTYPRTGYAKLPSDDAKILLRGMIIYTLVVFMVFFLGIAIFGDFRDPAFYRKWSPLMAALLMSGGFEYAYSKSGNLRCRVYTALAVILGSTFSIMKFEGYKGVVVTLIALGAVFVISGAVFFLTFMHKYPKAGEQTNQITDEN